MTNQLNLAKWVDCTEVEGPGKRFALWTQGCLLRCSGCCNPQLLDIVPKSIIEATEILTRIEDAKNTYGIEGVTFLGGEPMLQAQGLSVVAKGCQDIDLSVVVFTGYTLKYLLGNPMPGILDLLSLVDLLIAGEFILEKIETQRNWAGSANQKFHFLTDRYRSGIELDSQYSHGFELRLLKDGSGQVNGWPISTENMRNLKDAESKCTR